MVLEYIEQDHGSRGCGIIFRKELTLINSQDSNAIILPYQRIYAISLYQSGSSIMYVTNSSENDIENDLANWVEYDGVSDINLAITAVYFSNTLGTSNIIFVVKADGAVYGEPV